MSTSVNDMRISNRRSSGCEGLSRSKRSPDYPRGRRGNGKNFFRTISYFVLLLSAVNATPPLIKAAEKDGNDLNARDPETGETALMKYAGSGNADSADVVRVLLIGAQADLEAKDNDGWTALMWAARCGHDRHVEVVNLLIDAGAAVTAKDKDGKTALQHAKQYNHPEVEKLLEAHITEIIRKKEDNIMRLMTQLTNIKTQIDADNGKVTELTSLLMKHKTEGDDETRRRLALDELPVSTLVLGIASLLLLGYLVYQFKRRLTAKRQPVDTDLPTDLESGPAPRE